MIESMINPVATRLGRGQGCSLPESYRFHLVVHVHWIKPWRESELFPLREAQGQPPPLWFERDKAGNAVEVCEVDCLLDRRVRGRKVEYHVQWRGWDDESFRTWEPKESLLTGGADVVSIVRKWEAAAARDRRLATQSRAGTPVPPPAPEVAESPEAPQAPVAAASSTRPAKRRRTRGRRGGGQTAAPQATAPAAAAVDPDAAQRIDGSAATSGQTSPRPSMRSASEPVDPAAQHDTRYSLRPRQRLRAPLRLST